MKPETLAASRRLLQRAQNALYSVAPIGLGGAFAAASLFLITRFMTGGVDGQPLVATLALSVFCGALGLGLWRRLRFAYHVQFGVTLTIIGVLSAANKPDLVVVLGYGLGLGLIALAHPTFHRRAALTAGPRGWREALLLIALLIGAWLFVLALKDIPLPMITGTGTTTEAMVAVFMAGGTASLFVLALMVATPAAQPAPPPTAQDKLRYQSVLETAPEPRPEAVLAFAGDKTILFSENGEAALSYAVLSGCHIALGAPVGPADAWEPLLHQFKEQARAQGAMPAIYAAPPEMLPALHQAGFATEKIGENATLDLASYTLSGRKKEALRRGHRKLKERQGATFTLSLPPHGDALLASLEAVSTAWLSENGGREKAFSLGRFDRGLFERCILGTAYLDATPAAFGTLLAGPDKAWIGIDLMRFHPGRAKTNTMDFLLVEMILWAKANGYERFDLSMAPLSGLAEGTYAPFLHKVGRTIFNRGERFYNFQGIRRFKEKFGPEWEPRYIAAPSRLALPLALIHAARLTAGAGQQR